MNPGRLPIPVLALAGLLILLGHDLLMTANPHGQVSAHAIEPDAHELDCHMQEGIRAAPHDSSSPKPANLALPMLLTDVVPHALQRVEWNEAPDWPPGVSRAFLQVFLN